MPGPGRSKIISCNRPARAWPVFNALRSGGQGAVAGTRRLPQWTGLGEVVLPPHQNSGLVDPR
jgi:hypothetical protein